MATVYLGIGSNLGEREANIEKAVGLIKENDQMEFIAISKLIETEPEGAPGGKYLNGVIQLETELLPLELLAKLKTIERRLGRQAKEANAPRPMDLDILFYNDVVIVDGKNLTIPHPRITERLFVLEPLVEMAPDFVHPRLNKTVRQLYEERLHADPAQSPGA